MSNHTPGPWKIYDQNSENIHLGTVAPEGRPGWEYETICSFYEDVTPEDSVTFCAWLKPFENAQNNARLIAAAPELLEALKDAEFLLRKAGQLAGPMQDSFNRSAEDARAAIAKAEGA